MVKILAIGNSFSEDSTKYLYDLANCDKVPLKVVNLFLGGCCLENHWNNILENNAEYDYQLNGKSSGKHVSILESLQEEDWNIITIQQCSGFSGIMNSYYPYAGLISDYIKKHAPNSQQFIHQTWAYEIDSDHSHFSFYNNNQDEMYDALFRCYNKIASELSLNIIPFGEVIQKIRTLPIFNYKMGGKSLCRDGFHMNEVYGRYALAATWYAYILKKDILNNSFKPPIIDGVIASEEEIKQIKDSIIYTLSHSK